MKKIKQSIYNFFFNSNTIRMIDYLPMWCRRASERTPYHPQQAMVQPTRICSNFRSRNMDRCSKLVVVRDSRIEGKIPLVEDILVDHDLRRVKTDN